MAHGAEEALLLVNRLAGDLDGYGPFHAARADFYRTTGRWDEAEDAYRQAVALATNDPERRFLTGRLQEVRNARLA
jgi:RNA polymerase sigma-70 factor (ECF subfamily)